MRWVRKAVLTGGRRNVYKILVGKPARYIQLEISKDEACCTIKQLYIQLCRLLFHQLLTGNTKVCPIQWRTERGGGWRFQTPHPPRNSEGPSKSCQTQPDCEKC